MSIGFVLLTLSPLVAVHAEECPVKDKEYSKVSVNYAIGNEGITFEVKPWVVDVCHNKDIEWELFGPLGGDFEVEIDDEHGVEPSPGIWKEGKGNKKVKLKEFKHHGTQDPITKDKIAEKGTYRVKLTILGVGMITIDPDYRVYP